MKKSIYFSTIALAFLLSPVLSGQTNPDNADFKSYSKFDFVTGEKVIFFDALRVAL